MLGRQAGVPRRELQRCPHRAGSRTPMAAPSIKAVDAESLAPPPRKRRAPFVFVGLFAVAAGVAIYLYVSRLGKEKTDDAQVEAHVASISARIPGQVKRVLVNDNQDVKAGDVLIELDDRDQQAKLAAAKADLAAAQAQERAAQTQLALTEKTAAAN